MYSALHNHSEYSLLDGFSSPKEYLQRAREIGLKAFTVTEHGNMYSWVYYDKLKAEFPDIKILYGVEMYECFDMKEKDSESKYFHLMVIAKDEIGRKILNKLVTKSNFEGFYYKPRIDLSVFEESDGEHLIVSSACLASKIARESDYNKCIEYIKEYKRIFPHFFLELQSHKSTDQEIYNKRLLQLSKDTNTPFIITTDSHAATKEDLYYQGRHVQIAQDRETMSESYEGCYLQTEEEIHETMDTHIGYENVVIGLENTNKIADMCNIVNMPFQEPQLPTFPLPEGFKDNYDYLRHLCLEGWKKRKFNVLSEKAIKTREDRMEYELSIIHQMGFDGYFLIVWDFINWAKNNNIMTGAGRGSCAGSLVCYLLEITELDPITYNLIFERFLNVERISMPDTDSDFGDREPVVNYIIEKYGIDKVCQVINYSYITPIVAIKDVGRVLKIPYIITDKISKKFSYETFQECMDNNPNIIEQFKSKTDEEFNEKLKDLFNIASRLSGKLRQVSIHAGGVGIVDTTISDYMGMKLGSKSEHVIQVDKRLIEEIGIIKFDLLGVQTLNLVKQVLIDANINEWEINVNNPRFITDKKAYELLGSAKTNGVFQVESAGMKDLLLRLKPDNLEDLSALIALFRPDSMQFVEPYIKNKHAKKEDIEYIHEDMKQILENTYGCMLYQEQLLDIVRKFGGRTYGGADKFRKAIGKKLKEVVRAESEKLYNEILSQGYSKEIAFMVSDDMSRKGGYLFNKSHSMAYAVLCLQTAYLKAHYPAQFFKALLNINKTDNGALNKYIVDAQEFNVEILPPSINKSVGDFSIHDNKVLFGLEAVRGIGENFAKTIIDERTANGKFKGLEDFIYRVKPSDSQVVALTKAGAFPTKNKKEFLLKYMESSFDNKPFEYKWKKSLPTLLELNTEWDIDTNVIKDKEERLKLYNEKREIKQQEEYYIKQKEKYNLHKTNFVEKYLQDEEMWEFESLSVFINNNPFKDIYQYITSFDEIENGEKCVIVGVISKVVKKKDRNKNQFAYVTMYSATGVLEITCWASQFAKYQDVLKKDTKLAMLCGKKEDKAYLSELKPYDKWFEDTKMKAKLQSVSISN